MRTRRIEKQMNWKEAVGDTMHILNGGEVFAMNTLRTSDAETQKKIFNDVAAIYSAPEKSELFELAAEELGNDFMDRVFNVYLYGKSLMMIQNMRA